MTIDVLLSRLEAVRCTGRGRWIARCPAHEDKHPSLAVRELDDGRVLVHDFAGCDVEEVLAAAGLTFDALYPDRPLDHAKKGERRPFNAHDVLECLANEALIAYVASADLSKGLPLADADRERLGRAAQRIGAARELIHGR